MRQLFDGIFGQAERSTAKPTSLQRRRVQLGVERLEDRQLLAVGLFSGGQLLIEGNGQNDWAWVNRVVENGTAYYRAFGIVAGKQADAWYPVDKVSHIVFKGWAGNDDFQNGTTLPCTMNGGDGNDKLIGGFGVDNIYGDAGDDYIGDQTRTATVNFSNGLYGGAGNDTIVGSDGRDWIRGDAGNDRLYGGNGDDYLMGDAGNDLLSAGWGNDALWGGLGDDWLYGEQGDDWLAGNEGRDLIYGAAGKDHLHYDPMDADRDFRPGDGDLWWV